MIAIADYGMGNLRSVQKAFEKLNAKAEIISNPEQLLMADKLVLPGVGAFGACMENLRIRGMHSAVIEFAKSGKPFLGICLGMQVLFDVGEEMGVWDGLGLIPGRVTGFRQSGLDSTYKVPHIGWNALHIRPSCRMYKGIHDSSYVYFVHSYFVEPKDDEAISAVSEYGIRFCASVECDNIWATQFHPEKSGAVGLALLNNFAKL